MASTKMTKMRAVDIKNGAGPAESLFINDESSMPIAPAGWCIVKIKAFGLNRMDIGQREGKYPMRPDMPKTLGAEFSGTIESFGDPNMTNGFAVGDAVFGLAYGGAYAEYIAANTHLLIKKPDVLSWAEAAAIPDVWIAAQQALRLGEVVPGKSVLWHAGASAVSIAGIQLSRLAGASKILATAGSDEKCRFAIDVLGADAAFNYKEASRDWVDEVLAATGGKGVDIVVDLIGAPYFAKNLKVAGIESRFVMVGAFGGWKVDELDYGPLLFKRIRIEPFSLRTRDEDSQAGFIDELREVIPHFENGRLRVLLDKVFPWEQVQDAHWLMEAGTAKGKIVCTIGDTL